MFSNYDNYTKQVEGFKQKYVSLSDTQKELETLLQKADDEEIKKYLMWDIQLLMCCEIVFEHRKDEQGFLYPMLVYTSGVCIPDIDNFEEERMAFYEYRADEVNNLNLKIRYANYCFQYCIKNNRYKYSQKICMLLLDYLSEENLTHDYVVAFSRLLELVFSFKHTDVIEKLDKLIADMTSKEYSEDQYMNLISVSRIIIANVKNNFLTDDTVINFVTAIEKICNHYFEEENYNLYRNSAITLLAWYKFMKRNMDVDLLSIKYGKSYELDAEKASISYLIKSEWYKNAAEHYANIGQREMVYNMKVKIKDALKDASKNGEFKTVSTTQTIETKQLEEECSNFFKEDIVSTLYTVSHSSDFIISAEKWKVKAIEDAKNPIYQLVDIGKIQGNRKVYETNTTEELIKTLTIQNYEIELEVSFSVMFNYIWNRMVEDGLNAQMVIERICQNEYMDDEHKAIIARGIEKMFDKDYISALHILVPQFENYFRTFFEWGGFPTTSLKNHGLQYEKTFNEFLHEDFVRDTINDDFLYMIEFVLVEQLGKNLRNNIAHGLCGLKTLNKTNCLIVIYLFWIITAYKWNFTENETVEE